MKATEVEYLSELSVEYGRVANAKTLAELKKRLEAWKEIAWDAHDLVQSWRQDDWRAFKRARAIERTGQFAGEEAADRFGRVLLPEILIRVSLVAEQFLVPEGTAFKRLLDVGRLRHENGRVVWVEADSGTAEPMT